MKLDKALVEELAHIKAEKDKWTEKETKLVKKVKEKMEAKKLEEFAPDGCPYKLVLNKFKKSTVSWKDEWRTLAKKMFGKNWKQKQEELAEESKIDASTLCIELNENYKGGK